MDDWANNNILILGLVGLLVILASVIFAALRHALVRQLQSKIAELNEVLETNTKNIAKKNKQIAEKHEAFTEIKHSLQDLSSRNTELRHEFNNTVKKLENTTSNYEESHKDYLQAMQTIANNQKQYELDSTSQKNDYEGKLLKVQKDSDKEMEHFKENFAAEFDHLKKSHKRLVQANQTLSRNTDNLHEERDFYRTEFETLRDYLHDSQMDTVKAMVEARRKAGTDKVVKIPKKQQPDS